MAMEEVKTFWADLTIGDVAVVSRNETQLHITQEAHGACHVKTLTPVCDVVLTEAVDGPVRCCLFAHATDREPRYVFGAKSYSLWAGETLVCDVNATVGE